MPGYSEAGAQIVPAPADLYSKAELVVKVGPPCGQEMELLQEKQTIISALHLGQYDA
jgi:alanine dehydrogenase